MAARLSPEQVAEVACALGAVPDKGALSHVSHLAQALKESEQSAFSPMELTSIEAAATALEAAPAEQAEWVPSPCRGLFFVFEGLDRSGKSTQSKKLAEHLKEHADGPVKWMCFPNRATATGMLIDLYLQRKLELPDEAIHMLFSANRWEMVQTLIDDLNAGTTVVCDRYAFSGVAYSAAKGLDFAWCQAPDRGLPTPDGVFFLHVDEKEGASRANFGDERYENAELQARVRVQFREPQLRENVAWFDVDGARDIETIHEEIRKAAEEIRTEKHDGDVRPFRRLWFQGRGEKAEIFAPGGC
jgi:dTMP kinase